MLALLFSYEARDPDAFERAHGPEGDWARFFRRGEGYVGTELLRDVENPGRYLVVDRWRSREDYQAFLEQHREEFMRRVDDSAFLYDSELRFGTFESVWS